VVFLTSYRDLRNFYDSIPPQILQALQVNNVLQFLEGGMTNLEEAGTSLQEEIGTVKGEYAKKKQEIVRQANLIALAEEDRENEERQRVSAEARSELIASITPCTSTVDCARGGCYKIRQTPCLHSCGGEARRIMSRYAPTHSDVWTKTVI